ncbi:MAG: TatD family hydrolase [Proteobacteria bacterium]|nr:TatD family hydrolase [Pseudomonadota bacterium]
MQKNHLEFVDSHCHLNLLDLSAYQGNLGEVIEQAKRVGVKHILCVGIDLAHAQEVLDIAERFQDVSASVGVHPSEKITIDRADFIALAKHPKVVALGETGLDYHYPDLNKEQQQAHFRLHIEVAKQLQKPLIIHTRDAQVDTIRIMQEENAQSVGGVMHCFTENWEMAEQAIALNFYISFSGIVTFKNAVELAEVAQKAPLDKILIETDAPYLTPVPHRGKKPNEPQYVALVAAKIAELKNISIQEVGKQTTANFFNLFKLHL